MDNFSRCFAFTLGSEGGFTENAADPGNWTGGAIGQGALRGTKYGISAAAYPALDIANLTQADAQAIYRRDYWAKLQGDALPLPLAFVAFDAAVNAGLRRSVIWLQQAAGQGADGALGPGGAGAPAGVLIAPAGLAEFRAWLVAEDHRAGGGDCGLIPAIRAAS